MLSGPRSSSVPTWMNGGCGTPGAWAPIHVLACDSPVLVMRGTDHDAVTAVTCPLHTYPAMWPNDDSAPAVPPAPPHAAAPTAIAVAAATTPSHRPAVRIDSSPTIRPPKS